MQKIRQIGDITFVNDSKATNINATDQALKNFKNIYWILGGRMKEKNLQKKSQIKIFYLNEKNN